MPTLAMSSSQSAQSTSQALSRTTILREVTNSYSAKTKRVFGNSHGAAKAIVTVDDFLDYIADERLRRMPHRGSKWDKILQWAAFFASQTQLFQHSVGEFVSHSEDAARLVWTNLRILIEMGPTYVGVLEKIFSVFYNMALTLSFFYRNSEFFISTQQVQQSLAYVFSDLVKLVVDVTAQYGSQGSGSATTISTTEFYAQYRTLIESLYTRRDQISNFMWAYAIHQRFGHEEHLDIETIRRFLAPADRIVRTLSSNRIGSKGARAEYTCEWFQNHLTDFTISKDKVYLVTGKPGSGKSFLAGWVAERLQRQEGPKSYVPLTYSIDQDIKSQATVPAVMKGILLQLLDRNVGDMHLYEALSKAIRQSSHAKSTREIEDSLWNAVHVAIHHNPRNVMIVIDGLDALQGKDEDAIRLLERLNTLASQHSHVRSIVFSQPLGKAAPQKTRSFTIEAKHVQHDIRSHVHEVLLSSIEFHSLTHEDKDKMTGRITTLADGSFLWANLAIEVLKKEKTTSSILATLEKLPKTTNDLLKKLTTYIDLKAHDTRSLLAWLLGAERPLTLEEIKTFYEIHIGSCSHKRRSTDVEADVHKNVGVIVDINNGVVRFKHSVIRAYYVSLADSVKDYNNTGSFPFMMKEAHYDLATRCVAYVKIFLHQAADLAFEGFSADYLTDLFEEYTCLEYASTYWISHFYSSPMYDQGGNHKLVPEFRDCFPDSILLVLIESSKWTTYSSFDYELSVSIRQTILTEKSTTTLQAIIILARIYETLSVYEKAATYFYKAYQLTQTLIGEHSTILVRCAAYYLTCTSTTKYTEKTEVVTQREEMLKRVIRVEKETHGLTYHSTIKYTRMLAELYTETKQYEYAATTYRELYEIYVQEYGYYHSETKTVRQQLISVLEKTSKKEEITKLTRDEYEESRSLEQTDTRRTKSSWEMYQYYKSQKEYHRAEEVLVQLWSSTSREASSSTSTEVHKRNIEISSEYVSFLKEQKRTEEAESVLTSLWSEYKHSEMIKTAAIASSLEVVASQMRSFNMLQSAKSVYSSLLQYYQSSSTVSSSVVTSIATSLFETTQEIVESSSSSSSTSREISSTTTSSHSHSEESVLEEAFESLLTISSTSTSSSTTKSLVQTTKKLSSLYVQQQRWTECYRVCSKALTVTWSSLMTRKTQVTLASEHTDEQIEIAYRMAESCFHASQIEKAEEIYHYVFTAIKASSKVTDTRLHTSTKTLVTFYEQTYQFKKAIKVYEEVYQASKTQLGVTNTRTIEFAYEAADFCYKHYKVEDAEHYYLDIYTSLNKGQETVTHESIRACKVLFEIYERDARWESAETICKQLWTTFVQRGTEARFHTEFVEKIYSTYTYILKEVKKVSIEEIYKLTVTYKETCTKVYGERNEITLKATIALAQVCEQTETHREESVSLWEQITKHSAASSIAVSTASTALLVTAVSQAKHRLAKLYSEKSSTTSRAVTMQSENYTSTRSMYGYSDERTLTSLSELSSYYASEKKTESISTATTMLQTAAIEIVSTEKSTEKLTRSATTIAESYKKLEQTETAWSMISEMRRQVITGETSTTSKFSLKQVDRRAFTFIAAFEQTLSSTKTTISERISELITESMLYQTFSRSIKEKSSFETTFSSGLRLAVFYHERKRTEEYNHVWTQLQEVFAFHFKSSKESTTLREFFDICVKESQTNRYEIAIIRATTERVLSKMKESKFQEAYDLAWFVDRFIHLNGGFRSQEIINIGFKLCFHLTGRSGTSKASGKVHQSIIELTRTILSETLRGAKDLDMRFIEWDVHQINSIVVLLSEQQNYTDLEWILTELWHHRHSLNWDAVTIVWIGRRLVEVRFTVGKRDAAIHLCEDICYNLRRVWGPTDKTTVDMFDLLSAICTAAGEFKKALDVHEDLLRQTLIVYNDDGDLSIDQGASIAKNQVELLKRSYVRNGGFDADKGAQHYQDLFASLHESFGSDKNFDTSSVGAIDKWSTKDKVDDRGVWQSPASFELIPSQEVQVQKHSNNLRKLSGLFYGRSSKRSSGYGYSYGSSSSTSNGGSVTTSSSSTVAVNGGGATK